MPDILASLCFLADRELYKTTKPYHVLLQPQDGESLDNDHRLHNLEWETHDNINITDVRDRGNEFTIEKTGFEVGHHVSECLNFETADVFKTYKKETEEYHKRRFGAVYVFCYEVRVATSWLAIDVPY